MKIPVTFTRDSNGIRQLFKMLDFMEQNSLFIHPLHSLAERVGIVLESGRCPCNINRKECPCPESLMEIKKKGHCHCAIFFSRKGMEDFYSNERSQD